jgi:DNA gyrase/topoisomerase IV subunit B
MNRLAWVTNAKPAVIVVDDGRGIPVNGLGNVYR